MSKRKHNYHIKVVDLRSDLHEIQYPNARRSLKIPKIHRFPHGFKRSGTQGPHSLAKVSVASDRHHASRGQWVGFWLNMSSERHKDDERR